MRQRGKKALDPTAVKGIHHLRFPQGPGKLARRLFALGKECEDSCCALCMEPGEEGVASQGLGSNYRDPEQIASSEDMACKGLWGHRTSILNGKRDERLEPSRDSSGTTV